MNPTRRRFALALAATPAFVLARTARAMDARAIRIVIPGPPGGASDIMARILSDDLGRTLGQAVIVEPRPGAGGNVAADFVAKSAPDGLTLLFGDIGPLALNPTLFASLPYDPIKDFEPIGEIATFPWVVIVNPAFEARTLADIVRLSKQLPGGLSYATPGLGTPMHLTGEIIKRDTGANLVHVPYRGGGPATVDVLGGQVKMGIVGLPPATQYLKSGALRGIAVSTAAGAPSLPEIPSLQQAGLRDFDASVWYGVLAPKGTPRATVDRISAALDEALRNPANIERLAHQGVTPTYSKPEAFRAFIIAENRRWGPVVRASGAKVE